MSAGSAAVAAASLGSAGASSGTAGAAHGGAVSNPMHHVSLSGSGQQAGDSSKAAAKQSRRSSAGSFLSSLFKGGRRASGPGCANIGSGGPDSELGSNLGVSAAGAANAAARGVGSKTEEREVEISGPLPGTVKHEGHVGLTAGESFLQFQWAPLPAVAD